MGTVRQISEIRTEAFMSNNRDKFGFYGVFRGKKQTAYCENPCVVFVYNSQRV